ncbi:MAG: flagellar motor switch protein FliN [Candidatus Aminicenantes bacterium]|nr:MAG: flagellar motor switch protein FliN [Candidatus Aminicenantes bacterium]
MSNKERMINILVENWTSVYHTILGRDVQILVDSVQKKSKSDLNKVLGKFQSFVGLSYGDDKSQRIIIALSNKLVSIIANLMIGLDTFKDEIGADDRDAFEEAVNQMFSACQAPIKENFGLDMKFKNISFIESMDAAAMMGEMKLEVWNCTINLVDVARDQFVMVTPRGFPGAEAERKPARVYDKTHAKPSTAARRTTAAPGSGPGYHYQGTNIDLLLDVELPITVRIGTTEMRLVDIMKLGPGSIIELEKLVEDPVEVLVNGKLVARGEVVVCDSNFAVRITEVQSKAERIKSLA